MSAFADLVRFNPVAGGTTDWVVSSAVGGCQTPALANVQNGVSYKVYAVSNDLTQWEVSTGLYNSGTTTFPRTTVLYNSSGTGTATGQSGAGTKINFSTIPQVSIVAIAEDLIQVEIANSFSTTQQNQIQKNVGIPAVMRSYLAGLTLSTAGSSATFAVAAGVAGDSTNADMMTLAASISKTTGAWAVGSGNGSLDTGAVAISTWYHVFLIKRTDTQVVDVLFSLSVSAPTMPSSYTLFRRIGSMLTDASSHWVAFTQFGDEFHWAAMVGDVSNAAATNTAVTSTLTVPTGVQVTSLFRAGLNSPSAATGVLVTSLDENDVAPFVLNNGACSIYVGGGVDGFASTVLQVRTNTSAQIRWRGQIASTGTFSIATFGWIDRRGRDN
jgi:hypothetical protein